MTAALELPPPPFTVLDIHTHGDAANSNPAASQLLSPTVGLPFRASVDANATHTALAAYLTSYGFLCLLLFAGLNMTVLSSPALSTRAGERADLIVAFCCYSLALMLFLLFLAYYVYCAMSGPMLRAKTVRDSDRVLLDGDWLHAQQRHQAKYEQASAVSVLSVVRSDQAVRSVLTALLSLYCCASLVWQATQLSSSQLLVLLSTSGALVVLAVITGQDVLPCLTAFALSDCLQPLLAASHFSCPAVHTVRDMLLLTSGQLLLCTLIYTAARASLRATSQLLFSATFHSRLLVLSPTPGVLLTLLSTALCSHALHRMARAQPPQVAALQAADEESEDDADVSEEVWRVKQYACMAAAYALAANGWRGVHCSMGPGAVQYAVYLAVLLLLCAREYKLRERHKQV